MTTLSTSVSPTPAAAGPSVRSLAVRWFFTGAAIFMLAAVLIGFHHFYFEGRAYPGRPITPPIRTLVIVHGVSMMAWLLLFIVQPFLVAVRKRKLHMTLGWFAVALAAFTAVTATMVGIRSAQVAPPEQRIWGMNPVDFSSIPLLGAFLFTGFVAAAVRFRKKPAMHRAFMFAATLTAVDAGLSRIDVIANLYAGTVLDVIFSAYLPSVVLGFVLVGLRSVLMRSVDRWLLIAVSIMTAAAALTMLVVRTGVWGQVVGPVLI